MDIDQADEAIINQDYETIEDIIDKKLEEENVPEKEREILKKALAKTFEKRRTASVEVLAACLELTFDALKLTFDALTYSNNLQTKMFNYYKLAEHLLQVPPIDVRMVSVTYEIKETKLSHRFDLESFAERVVEVANVYYSPQGENYVAPYFCLIQSSGMGKTKILHECREMWKATPDVSCKLILSGPAKVDATDVFDEIIDLGVVIQSKRTAEEACGAIFSKFDELFLKNVMTTGEDTNTQLLVLMFDEAQFFLEQKLYGYDVFLFRVVRLWLRISRPDTLRIVAVFTGTNAELRNFQFENDHTIAGTIAPSRELSVKKVGFRPKGMQSFSHFVQMTTIGCKLSFLNKASESESESESEYVKAIFYGRPLFATMQSKGDMTEDKLSTILGRMLLVTYGENQKDWKKHESTWLNILGTRVQMGQTTVSIASDLVARGYANLIACTDRTATICYLPDPVCARLAMCLMEESQKLNAGSSTTYGQPARWWVARMRDLFAGGLCQPERGDFGEIMVAFFMLLCGDKLRKTKDPTFKTFSVNLADWLHLLSQGGKEEEQKQSRNRFPKRDREGVTIIGSSYRKAEISFIQVCRNYLRHYEGDWGEFFRQDFLKYMYESGIAFFVFAGCSVIDMVIAIRLTTNSGLFHYVPLVVSIKSRGYFSPSDANGECSCMRQKGKGRLAMCLLVIFSSTTMTNDGGAGERKLVPRKDVGELMNGSSVEKVLRIPSDDAFGLTDAFMDLTKQGDMGEVYASHYFLRNYNETEVRKSLRSSAGQGDKGTPANMLATLKSQFQER